MTQPRSLRFRLPVSYGALPALLVLAASAQAQEKPKVGAASDDALQEVVVTGSRIARPELDRLEPTITLDSKTIDNRGYADVGQVLSEMPGFGVPPSSAANTQAGFGIAQSFVDLYSLGSQRTLVLVNGRRFVSGNSASNVGGGSVSPGEQVDLNTIPTKLIDHVDNVSVGGAPIYGADAIAGTVNIILKKDFQGLDVDGQVGVSNQTDAWNYRARVLAGQNFMDGRGNVTVSGEFTKSDGLVGTSRPVYASDLGFLKPTAASPYATVLTPANSVPAVNFGGIPLVDDTLLAPAAGLTGNVVGVTDAAGHTLAWGNSPYLQPYNPGTATGNPIFASGGDGLRLSTVSNLLSPTERINFDTLLNFAITDHIKAFGEGWFSETHATNLLAQPAYNTNLFGTAGTTFGNFVLNINNPFLSANDRTLIQNALNAYGAATTPAQRADPNWSPNNFYVSRANIDLQSGRATATQVLARGVLGLQGDFSLYNRNFNWDVSMNYGRVDANSVVPAYVFQNVQNALNAVVDPATGQIACAPGAVNAPTNTLSSSCAPLNIFGNGSPSLAARQYITHLAQAQTLNSQRDFVANFGADLWTLPWGSGTWKASVGFENRRETAKFSPDEYYTLGLGQNSTSPVKGDYTNNETYGETLVPITSPAMEIPGLYRVELEGAVRHVINSLSGGATTYTEGLKWAPTRDVLLRINKTKSIRAPAISELFLPTATSFQFSNDPCDVNFVHQGNNQSQRAANCAAAGIDTSTFVSNVVNASAQGTISGNAALQPETANSKTFGIVLTPRWIPKLELQADYVYIRLTQAISSLTLVELMDACYDSSNYPSDPSCRAFTRDPATHQVTGFQAGYVNAGLLEFGGIIASGRYTADFPGRFGSLTTGVQWYDMQQLNQQIGSNPEQSLAGTLSANAGLQATPRHTGTIDLDYRVWNLDWDVQGRFVGSSKFSNQDGPTDKDIEVVHKWWLINSTVSYAPIENLSVRFIVDNVFNKQPPYPALAGAQANFTASTSLYFPGIIGRTYQLGVGYKFNW